VTKRYHKRGHELRTAFVVDGDARGSMDAGLQPGFSMNGFIQECAGELESQTVAAAPNSGALPV
jgi:hypothetical protein